jgi:hypothetical protein
MPEDFDPVESLKGLLLHGLQVAAALLITGIWVELAVNALK